MSDTSTSTAKKKSVFDTWLENGRFSADAFRQENALTRIKQAVESIQEMASVTPDVSLPSGTDIKDTMSLMVYLAHAAKALGDNSKVFANGRRQVVYFATSYATDMPDKDERIKVLAEMPKLFSYQLGSTPTKAWRDILSNVNVYPHMSRSVGKGDLPQAILGKVSSAVTSIASGYTDPASKRKVVRDFFDGYWRQFGTFATDKDETLTKPNASELKALWSHAHPEEMTDDRTKRRTTASKETAQRKRVDRILTGKADDDDLGKLDAFGQAYMGKRIKKAGFKVVTRQDLLQIENALGLDYKRKDAIGVLEEAQNAIDKLTIEVSTQLQFARDHAAKPSETPELPIVDCKRASFIKAFKFTGKEVSDLERVDIVTISRQGNNMYKTDIAGSHDGSKVFSSVVTSAKLYAFRNTRKEIENANEFQVKLV